MTAKIWWMISKDLLSEYRSRRVWPAMLLMGVIVALVFAVQMNLPPGERRQIVGGLLWLAIFFAGTLSLDRSFAAEREDGCWEGLLMCPVSPTGVFLAKFAVNAIALAVLQAVLVPLLAILADVPLLVHPGAIVLVVILGNVGISAIGTLVSALATAARNGAYLLPLLVLPLAIPIVLAAAEATRLAMEHDFAAAWWRWIQLLAAGDVIFVTLGIVLFDFAIED